MGRVAEKFLANLFFLSIWLKYSFTSFDIFMMVPAMTLISGYWQLSNCSFRVIPFTFITAFEISRRGLVTDDTKRLVVTTSRPWHKEA